MRTATRIKQLTLLLSISLAGCASTQQDVPPPTVTLPLRHAGITDARHRFLEVFSHELSDPHAAASLLHLPPPGCATDQVNCNDTTSTDLLRSPSSPKSTAVVLVPGIFFDCMGPPLIPFISPQHTQTGKTRQTALDELKALSGLATVTIAPIGGRLSSAENAKAIIQELLSVAENSTVTDIVVIAYSKGVADSLNALVQLESAGKLPPKVKAFVSLAGAVMGSDRADGSFALYQFLSIGFLASTCKASSHGQEVIDLTRSARQSWMASTELPASVKWFSVAAYTSREKTHPLLRSSFDAMAPNELRNDGQVATSLTIIPASTLVAFVNSDHWEFVLPLEEHPSKLIRGYFSSYQFPRAAFFRSLVRFVHADVSNTTTKSSLAQD